ncbi:MAG: nucleoside deaminase [Rikenellaceae bacterium]
MNDTQQQHEFFMNQALEEARKALSRSEVPIGAVVVYNGRIVGRGHNMTESLGDATAHAEMQALTSAASTLGNKYLADCTLYVTIEPCVMCAGACYWSQIGHIVYGAQDNKRGYSCTQARLLHPKTKVEKGVLEHECSRLVSDFFKRLRK